ncbi:MAG: hypothetical protein CSH37_10600 [Thalassolituus sp.]|nr:MAG: hypothetical protein CSH37_10600 [Thalassolituus sp.]
MPQPLNTSEDFLLAAKHAEIAALQQLQINCTLVTRVTELIHELQRERGLSNTYLVSDGQRFSQQRDDELKATGIAEVRFRDALTELNQSLQFPDSARLLSSIAFVIQCLEGLPALRQQVTARKISAKDNTLLFSRLISGLLTVVFEAADIADDPEVTRALVALFNFLQGKEYAGQERAMGLIGFTQGNFSNELQEKVRELKDAQAWCFDIYTEFSTTIPKARWRQLESSEATTELDRLRRMIERYRSEDSLPTSISEVWYEVATRRIDEMQSIELDLTADLTSLCDEKIQIAEEDLRLHREHLKELAAVNEPPESPLALLPDGMLDSGRGITPGVNVKLARSISDLVQGQAERLQRISSELAEARQALDERKLIDKAKGLLIQSKGISEDEAYRHLRQAAMDSNKRMVEVAVNVISVAGMLSSG